MAENLSNGAQTTLNGSINNSQTTATLTSASGWPVAPFRALISAEGGNTDEIIYVGARSGTSLSSITRAAEAIADGTQSAQAHSSGATITQVLTRTGFINIGSIHPLDRTTITGMDTTFGDDFTESSLNARWTRVNQTSGEESYQQGPRASALSVTYGTGTNSRYIYQAQTGTTWTFETSFSIYQPTGTGQMFGILALDSSQNGVGAFLYDSSAGLYLGNVVTGAYSTILSTAGYPTIEHRNGHRLWVKLRDASGTFFVSYSYDGEVYSPELSGTPSAFTMARIGIGKLLGTVSGDTVAWHWFDKTA